MLIMLQVKIIFGITAGLLIVVLEDKCGGRSYTIGVNRGLNIIYEHMEKHELQLYHDNLSKYCGHNVVFERFVITAELKDNRVHAKIPENQIREDNLFKKIL